MDRAKDERKQIDQEIAELKKEMESGEPIVADFDKLRSLLWRNTNRATKVIDQRINSLWTWGKEKRNLIAFRELLIMNTHAAEGILDLYELSKQISGAVVYLAKEIEKSQGKTQGLTEKMAKLEESTKEKLSKTLMALQRLDQLLNSAEGSINSQNKPNEAKDGSAGYRV